jgi:hypothetical protein
VTVSATSTSQGITCSAQALIDGVTINPATRTGRRFDAERVDVRWLVSPRGPAQRRWLQCVVQWLRN